MNPKAESLKKKTLNHPPTLFFNLQEAICFHDIDTIFFICPKFIRKTKMKQKKIKRERLGSHCQLTKMKAATKQHLSL
jgi:hypothetical protein